MSTVKRREALENVYLKEKLREIMHILNEPYIMTEDDLKRIYNDLLRVTVNDCALQIILMKEE